MFQAIAHLLLFFAVSCTPERKENLLQGLTSDSVFSRADQLRNSGQYEDALAIYDSLLQHGGLPAKEYNYAASNRQLCRLLLVDTLSSFSIQPLAAPTGFSGKVIGNLLDGILETRQGRPGLRQLYKTKSLLRDNTRAESFEYFLTLESLGWCHFAIVGEPDSAAHYYKELLSLAYTHSELASHIPRILVQLAEVAIVNRDFVSSRGYTEEGLRSQPDDNSLHELLILKGTLLRRMEQFDSAGFYYQLAENSARKKGDSLRLGKVLRERILFSIIAEDDSVFYSLMASLQGLPTAYSNNHMVSTDRLLGYYFFLKGKHKESVEAYEKALAHFSAYKVPDPVQVMEAHYGLSAQYRMLGEYDKAGKYVYHALTYFTSLRNTTFSWERVLDDEVARRGYSFVNYKLLAELELSKYTKKQDERSLARSYQMYRMIDSLMFENIRVIEEDALLRFLLIGRSLYAGGIETCYYLYQNTKDSTYLNQAHSFMERSKGLITYQDILTRSDDYFSFVPKVFRSRELLLKGRMAAIKKMYAYNSQEMSDLLAEINRYYEEMELKYPDYYNAKYKQDSKPFQYFTKEAKSRNTTMVQYFMNSDHIYFIKYDHPVQFQRVKYDSSFTSALQVMRKEVSLFGGRAGNAEKAFMQSSSTLYRHLIEPLQNIRTSLLIVPDGPLGHIPFEALVPAESTSFKKADYLVKSYDINYAPSLGVYELNYSAESSLVNNILGYAFTRARGRLSSLPGTKKELMTIKDILSGVDLTYRENEEIDRTQLFADLSSSYDIIHVGLHASSSFSDRLENKIELYSEAEEFHEVYGYEIAPLSIKAHTVVLTACESGFGPVVPGEGTYSLARAFKQAGVTNVIGSLWNISDVTTANLIPDFYQYFQAGNPASRSLTFAKRNYLEQADELTAHPHFWAGLICQGN